MAEATTTQATTGGYDAPASAAPAKPPSAFWRKVRWQALNVFAGAVLLYLFLPITVIIIFSFNDPAGRFNLTWNQFSLDAWKHPFAVQGVQDALKTSIEIAALSTLIGRASCRERV